MKNIALDTTKAVQFLKAGTVEAYEPKVKAAQEALENGTCEGNDFLGWLHLPSETTEAFLDEIQACANTLREKCEVVVVAATPLLGSWATRKTPPSCSPATTSVRTTLLS